MKVIVLGAGVVGTTTAWELARSGCAVTVIDRQSGPAQETSFANAGQVSPGYSTPWAAPGIPLKAVKWLFEKHAPLSVRPDGSLFQLRWLAAMLRNCSPQAYTLNKERMMRLATYSRDRLRGLRGDTGIAYEQRTQGTLQLFRTQDQLDHAGRDIEVLRECGVRFELLDREGVARAEPALGRTSTPIAGGLRLPDDETGDCFAFTNALAQMARGRGVTFRFGTGVRSLLTGRDGSAEGVTLESGEVVKADRVVVALGSFSRELLTPLGIDLPVYPVKGYSLTIPITDASLAPVSTVLDETYKIALTRFDDRIRVGGMAELGGYGRKLRPQRRATLEMVTRQLFPGGDIPAASFWCGLRPMTPDSTPIVGATHTPNLFINTGHGTLGWTMACGSARLVADLVSGQAPDIRYDDLGIARYDEKAGSRGTQHPALGLR